MEGWGGEIAWGYGIMGSRYTERYFEILSLYVAKDLWQLLNNGYTEVSRYPKLLVGLILACLIFSLHLVLYMPYKGQSMYANCTH